MEVCFPVEALVSGPVGGVCKWILLNNSVQTTSPYKCSSLAIVLTLAFVWLYFNVSFKSDIQFNFLYKFRASFWSSLYCCGVLFHSGLWVWGSGSCQSVVSPLLSDGRDHRSNAQMLYLEPPFTTASCSRNTLDQDVNILSLFQLCSYSSSLFTAGFALDWYLLHDFQICFLGHCCYWAWSCQSSPYVEQCSRLLDVGDSW